ncbi:hypothetical protein STAS_22085 [Striga asiatica]|uniref:Uncharacterized protein n=1 Tax=Striga asiatica TaxID=4170 RepID=A0A5A7QJE0_STRAF|nr:hypothetical protein STAS_22085 [Striga asiatica]
MLCVPFAVSVFTQTINLTGGSELKDPIFAGRKDPAAPEWNRSLSIGGCGGRFKGSESYAPPGPDTSAVGLLRSPRSPSEARKLGDFRWVGPEKVVVCGGGGGGEVAVLGVVGAEAAHLLHDLLDLGGASGGGVAVLHLHGDLVLKLHFHGGDGGGRRRGFVLVVNREIRVLGLRKSISFVQIAESHILGPNNDLLHFFRMILH